MKFPGTFLLIFLFAASMLTAQTRSTIRLVNQLGNTYNRMFVEVDCGDSVYYDLQPNRLFIAQDGDTVVTFNYLIENDRPYAQKNACYDVGLVFDNSSAMSGPTFSAMVQAGKAFVDSMTLACQSATIVSFSDVTTIQTFVTNDHVKLDTAIDKMTASGGSRLYDGVYAAMIELNNDGRLAFHPIIVMTNGGDDGRGHGLDETIEKARREYHRIFVVGIGSNVKRPDLERLAVKTGGIYYQVDDPTQLTNKLIDLEAFTQRAFDEYRITYQSPHAFPPPIKVTLSVKACNIEEWVSTSYQFREVLSTGVIDASKGMTLEQNYPNPARRSSGEAVVDFTLPESGGIAIHAVLTVTDVLGRVRATLYDHEASVGRNRVSFNTRDFAPGVYFYQLRMGDQILTRPMMITE